MSFFFDSHFHATLKKHFASQTVNDNADHLPPRHPWRTVTRSDLLKGFKDISLRKCILRQFVENSLVSQSSFTQLTDSGFKLAIMALFAPDKGLLELIMMNPRFMKIVKQKKFGPFLSDVEFENLHKSAPIHVLKADLQLMEMTVPGRDVLKLNSYQFNPQEGSPLEVVFSVEGLHSLRSNMDEQDPQKVIDDILKNLDEITVDNPVVSINLAHIDHGNDLFANQAYAMDAFREGGFLETHLRPIGNGLSTAGKNIASKLYARKILTDVKHMSVLARKQFYQFRREQDIREPLVSSHAGFTGCWFNNDMFAESVADFIVQIGEDQIFKSPPQHKVVLSKPNPYLESSGIGFNASSINLFNEDIKEILDSDGLIGISLDQRILGFSNFQVDGNFVSKNVVNIEGNLIVTDTDFLSVQELPSLPEYNKVSNSRAKIFRGVSTVERETGNSTDIPNYFHPRHFYLHVLHALQVARLVGHMEGTSPEDSGRKMLTRTLCIGSDFDGLIDGLDCCPNVSFMENFKTKFIKEFGAFLDEVDVKLPAGLTIPALAERIFYENGRDFILRRMEALDNV